MNINRQLIDSVILALIVWFMRRDIVLALVVAVASYVLRMITL
jgi:uncharacterized membrane protein